LKTGCLSSYEVLFTQQRMNNACRQAANAPAVLDNTMDRNIKSFMLGENDINVISWLI